MILVENIFVLLSGFVLLGLSGDKLVETSVRIARYWKIPTSIIAVTVISGGTSSPEFFTSFLAGLEGRNDLSVGNIIGSNIFNILVVGGISLVLQPYAKIRGTFSSWLVLIVASFLFFFSLKDFHVTSHEAFLLLGGLGLFIFLSFLKEKEKNSGFENLETVSINRSLFFFFLSLGGLILGAQLVLNKGVALGVMAGLSHQVIAITILSVGTGLPELATSIAAAFRGHGDIAIANVIGSNIFNSLGILGITAGFFPLDVTENVFNFDFYVMSLATLGFVFFYIIKIPEPRKWMGGLMLISYTIYIVKLLCAL